MSFQRLCELGGLGLVVFFVVATASWMLTSSSEARHRNPISADAWNPGGKHLGMPTIGVQQPEVAKSGSWTAPQVQPRVHSVIPKEVKTQENPEDSMRYRIAWAYARSVRDKNPNAKLRKYAEDRGFYDQTLVDRFVRNLGLEQEACKHVPQSEPVVALKPQPVEKRIASDSLITLEQLATRVVKDKDGVRLEAGKQSKAAMPDPTPEEKNQELKEYVAAWFALVRNKELTAEDESWVDEAMDLAHERGIKARQVVVSNAYEPIVVLGIDNQFIRLHRMKARWLKKSRTWSEAVVEAMPRERLAGPRFGRKFTVSE